MFVVAVTIAAAFNKRTAAMRMIVSLVQRRVDHPFG
jgi:hypothetical protein